MSNVSVIVETYNTPPGNEIGIAAHAVPYFCAASFVMRGIEIIGGVVTVLSPDYFRRRFRW